MDTIFYISCLGGFAFFCKVVSDGIDTLANKFGWREIAINEKERFALVQASRDLQDPFFKAVNQICGERNIVVKQYSFDRVTGILTVK